jgi:hypothetical protein
MLASRIKGVRINLGLDQNYLVLLSRGSTLDALYACSGVRRYSFTDDNRPDKKIKICVP